MALPDANPKQEVSALHWRKLLYLLSGKTGTHQQTVDLTGFSNNGAYTLKLRNRVSPGPTLAILASSGGEICHVNDLEFLVQNLTLVEQVAPGAVTAGAVALYAKTDELLYYMTHSGVERQINGVAYGQNYLVNPGFEVWSRGAGPFTTDGDWTADKWQMTEGAASTTSISRAAASDPGSEYILAWSQSATGATSSVAQTLEKPEKFRSKIVTFSMRVKTAYASAARIIVTDGVTSGTSAFHTGGNSYETLSASITVSAAATSLTATLQLAIQGQAHTGEADNAVVSISSAPVPYEPLPNAEEQLRCRRFRQVMSFADSGGAYDGATTGIYAARALSPPMSNQTTPTITRSLDVITTAAASAAFAHGGTTAVNTSDSYGYHTLTTSWTKGGDNRNAILSGTVTVEIRA